MVEKRYTKSIPIPRRIQKLMKTRKASNLNMLDVVEDDAVFNTSP